MDGSLSVLVYIRVGLVHLNRRFQSTYGLSTIWSMVRGSCCHVDIVDTLGWLEAHVIVAGLVVLAEAELGDRGEHSLCLLL